MRRLLIMSVVWSFLSGAMGAVFHVSNSGSHVSPFSSIATGSTNIQSSVDLAGNGDTVLIEAGNYLLSAEIAISFNILVRGSSDPLQTVVDGGGFVRCFNLEDIACTISGLTITNGYTEDEGGGILCDGLSAVITNCIIVGNHAAIDGGGVYLGTVCDSVISGNTADWGGGTYDTEIYNSTISENTAMESGGGVLGGLVQNCKIRQNQSLADGAALFFSEANNCVISGNIGGGSAYSDLYSCTVVSNSISGNGGGSNGGKIFNSIIYYNTATAGDDNIYEHDLHYSCSPDTVHGVGENITTAPVFVNVGTADFHLQTTSPCKNTGNNAEVPMTTDLDGNTRIVGGTVDMGAYELQGTPTDMDGDGMLDDWEIQYFVEGTNAQPNVHGDTDPFTNLEEYIAGTDPTNAASFFAVTNGLAAGNFVVEWLSVSARVYKVLWAESLTNGFVQQGLMIDHPQNSYTDTLHHAEASGFYKVEVQLK